MLHYGSPCRTNFPRCGRRERRGRKMSDISIGPISVSVLTICVAAVGTAYFCCIFFYLSPSYREARAGRASPYGGENAKRNSEGNSRKGQRQSRKSGNGVNLPV
ncbi:unnamed protein product [Scytosiphon promiscuus]